MRRYLAALLAAAAAGAVNARRLVVHACADSDVVNAAAAMSDDCLDECGHVVVVVGGVGVLRDEVAVVRETVCSVNERIRPSLSLHATYRTK